MNAPPRSYGPPSGSYPQPNPYIPQAPSPYAPAPQPYAQPPNPYAPHAAYAQNPYAPPQVQPYGGYAGYGPAAPLATRLYTPGHVSLATFLGTPLAGSVIMAMNENRLGRKGTAVKTVLAGIAGTIVLLIISFALPDNFPAFPINIVTLLLMGWIARSRQGATVARHIAAGGRPASGWAAAGIALLCLFVTIVPLVAVFVAIELVKGGAP